MKNEHAGAGKDLIKVLIKLKDTLDKDFGFKKEKKKINVVDKQKGIKVEKKKNAFDLIGGGGAKKPANDSNLLSGGADTEFNILQSTPETKKPAQTEDVFGFVTNNNKPAVGASPEEGDLLGGFGVDADHNQAQNNDSNDLLGLGVGQGEPQTNSNDNILLGLEPNNTDLINGGTNQADTNNNKDFNLLDLQTEHTQKKQSAAANKKKDDPFNFLTF